MRKNAVSYAIGKLLQVMGVTMMAPLGIALWDSRKLGFPDLLYAVDVEGCLAALIISILCGTALVLFSRSGRDKQGLREGYAIVTLGWLGLTLIGAIPLFIYFTQMRGGGGFDKILIDFTDAYFEIMSGFTTTGATILTNIEIVPRSLLFLRALTHWLGGMGIITLAIVIFPAMGVSGYSMFRGEVPGPSKDRLRPRLAQTAQILWGVYGLLTAAEAVLLMIAGMNWFDAVCHSFATMATGGFSTMNASVAGYESDMIEWIITLFMFFAGINFVLHFKAIRGDLKSLVKNREFLFYSGVILATIVVITAVLYINGPASEEVASQHFRASQPTVEEFHTHYVQQNRQIEGLYDCFRIASFQALAIITTTGFVTADFDLWPDFLRFLLVFLMFFGGCAGSTGGGIKIIRIMIVFKTAILELRKLVQPRLVATVKLGGAPIEDEKIINIVSFFILFVGLFVITGALMTLFVPDLTTAMACSIATIGNIGPGLAGIGAVENYAWIPIPGKWILVLSMLLGRLEIFTVLIVLRMATWRK
ncbi:MAG: TrkH family potassium uptake protein [candidate division Zixibacteria bacterium]|nr:TrkH family potassium uptake protein [candidate division Zixibacteria bacterium]